MERQIGEEEPMIGRLGTITLVARQPSPSSGGFDAGLSVRRTSCKEFYSLSWSHLSQVPEHMPNEESVPRSGIDDTEPRAAPSSQVDSQQQTSLQAEQDSVMQHAVDPRGNRLGQGDDLAWDEPSSPETRLLDMTSPVPCEGAGVDKIASVETGTISWSSNTIGSNPENPESEERNSGNGALEQSMEPDRKSSQRRDRIRKYSRMETNTKANVSKRPSGARLATGQEPPVTIMQAIASKARKSSTSSVNMRDATEANSASNSKRIAKMRQFANKLTRLTDSQKSAATLTQSLHSKKEVAFLDASEAGKLLDQSHEPNSSIAAGTDKLAVLMLTNRARDKIKAKRQRRSGRMVIEGTPTNLAFGAAAGKRQAERSKEEYEEDIETALEKGHLANALLLCTTAYAKFPDWLKPLMLRAELYGQFGMWDQMKLDLQKALVRLGTFGTSSEDLTKNAYLLRAKAESELGNFEYAQRYSSCCVNIDEHLEFILRYFVCIRDVYYAYQSAGEENFLPGDHVIAAQALSKIGQKQEAMVELQLALQKDNELWKVHHEMAKLTREAAVDIQRRSSYAAASDRLEKWMEKSFISIESYKNAIKVCSRRCPLRPGAFCLIPVADMHRPGNSWISPLEL